MDYYISEKVLGSKIHQIRVRLHESNKWGTVTVYDEEEPWSK